MAKKKSQRDPFEITLTDEKRAELTQFLAREIDFAMTARMAIVGDDGSLDDAALKYQGGDPNLTTDTPWPGAANLGSPIVTEKVDAMRARIMATIFTDPIWIVEGFGAAADRAAIVEEFQQWKADQTKLAQFVGRAVHNALIEGTGVLEVSDRVVLRKTTRQMQAKLQQDPQTQLVALDDKGAVSFVRDQNGRYVEAQRGDAHARVVVRDTVRASSGPSYRVCSLKDFYILPGHASERDDIWGYAKRVYRRLAELQQRQRDGYYTNVDQLGGPASSERLLGTGGVGDAQQLARDGQDIAPQQDAVTAEKELWELTLLLDLDDDGIEEWVIITFSAVHRQILRVQYENYDTPSYILLTPFPRPNSIYGFSYAKDKLGSLYDEHTALRNMFTDRMTLKTNAPMIQVEGSPWNPAERPFGPGEVLPVRDLSELKQLEVSDVPQSVIYAIKEVLASAERLSGMNDTTTGQTSSPNTTLGDVKLSTQQSWIRIDEVVKNMQQGIEDLFNILLLIWKNKLRDDPEPWPGDLMESMHRRDIDIGNTVTADILDGAFRGKPRGSVEASEFSQMRADLVQMLTSLTQLAQQVPVLKQQLNNPATIRAILSEIVRLYRFQNRTAFLGGFSGQMPPPVQEPPKPPEIKLSIQADAGTDPVAQQILAKAAQGDGLMPPAPQMPPPQAAPQGGAPLGA